ncbi:hypothetical protein RAY_138 [Erwinia phage vB_EamM_RAY]|uniref:Uncharacterized protein n=5 Tax=Agricanvirus TaxID=1984776 RepID=A0A173GES3_9CAUD|nr:hypothetical protein FDH98_gp138 [Erwinia phage vB_EamM_RAY]YP_009605925.1 hypothetical protein FDH99_gp141 [Erwinia phage vB_EamM_Simmy50]YP_009606246.1 hypothetical protein FDI00_gp140 [Erwinia phage vB_EamM_Special G]AUG85926.1 hypothetical protein BOSOLAPHORUS_139 [Erwinia phage vB_EamM_Bosolaphorus]AUG86891.1 hypothetical protein MORTIMER_142 [Erwinia phage vB_EamM_Mortimer]ANH51603.1 hypothetical protein SIMMY50_141 [Erwinia phage vB_EamM_Simmy50]ANH51919.1 hypothetical protein RAY_1
MAFIKSLFHKASSTTPVNISVIEAQLEETQRILNRLNKHQASAVRGERTRHNHH